jgi:DNA-binding transcriptional ArsR family regulator
MSDDYTNMSDDYTIDRLSNDLSAMVKAGLLDIRMREDGEWVYVVADRVAAMSEEEREEALLKMYEDDEDDEL